MCKKKIAIFFYKFFKRVIKKLFDAGVFNEILKPSSNFKNINIIKGENSAIDPSAVFITNQNGLIILKGNNRIGRQTEIQPGANGCIKIGQGTSIQDRNIIIGDVEIGRYCLTAPNVYLSSGRHYFDLAPNLYIKDQDTMAHSSKELSNKHSKKIVIEDDVWVGINSVVMSGVKIGRGSIIGSNSVVTKDVPPFSIMAGSPAKLIKKRLEFVPKADIKFDNDNDLPNFYKGFLLNMDNINKDRDGGGLSATKIFSVYLINTGKKIELIIKKLTEFNLQLTYNNQCQLIDGSGFISVSFESSKDNFHQFSVDNLEIDEDFKLLLIQSITVKN